MILYRFSAVRARNSPAEGPQVVAADFSAVSVAAAWKKIIDMLPCDGEWSCQLWHLGSRQPRSLKPRTFIRVTEETPAA